MAYTFQVTIDSVAPHDLAEWWAEALGWAVEPSDEAFIRRMVDEGRASEEDTTRHRGVLVWKAAAAIVGNLGALDDTVDARWDEPPDERRRS